MTAATASNRRRTTPEQNRNTAGMVPPDAEGHARCASSGDLSWWSLPDRFRSFPDERNA